MKWQRGTTFAGKTEGHAKDQLREAQILLEANVGEKEVKDGQTVVGKVGPGMMLSTVPKAMVKAEKMLKLGQICNQVKAPERQKVLVEKRLDCRIQNRREKGLLSI